VLVAWLAHNTFVNMRARGIQSGFGFLTQRAGFDIGETLIPYGSLAPGHELHPAALEPVAGCRMARGLRRVLPADARRPGRPRGRADRKVGGPAADDHALSTVSLVFNFISTFKDTSLVTIVSLYELTGSPGLAFSSDRNWRPFAIEGYLFIAAIYRVFCFSMSRYSLWIERRLDRSRRR
jgi:hypothetical protein